MLDEEETLSVDVPSPTTSFKPDTLKRSNSTPLTPNSRGSRSGRHEEESRDVVPSPRWKHPSASSHDLAAGKPTRSSARVLTNRTQSLRGDVFAARRSEPVGMPGHTMPGRHSMVERGTAPSGKNVLRRAVAARGETSRLTRKRSSQAAVAAASGGSSCWVVFEPAKVGGPLSAEAREVAQERVRAALSSHFLFQSSTPEQIEQFVKCMRHKIVRAGNHVCVQGERAFHFHVCTQGGFDMSVKAAGAAGGGGGGGGGADGAAACPSWWRRWGRRGRSARARCFGRTRRSRRRRRPRWTRNSSRSRGRPSNASRTTSRPPRRARRSTACSRCPPSRRCRARRSRRSRSARRSASSSPRASR